jgi:hypothetical protein
VDGVAITDPAASDAIEDGPQIAAFPAVPDDGVIPIARVFAVAGVATVTMPIRLTTMIAPPATVNRVAVPVCGRVCAAFDIRVP